MLIAYPKALHGIVGELQFAQPCGDTLIFFYVEMIIGHLVIRRSCQTTPTPGRNPTGMNSDSCHIESQFHWLGFRFDFHLKPLPTVVAEWLKRW